MNNKNLDKFISDMESIKMTSYEKNELGQKLASFAMSYTPVVSPYQHFMLMAKRGMAIAMVAFLSIGSITNAVSADALPGDALYGIKIAHEEIKSAVTVNEKKKISYEIKRTEKRIQEAAEVVATKKPDAKTQATIADNIKKQTKKVKDQIKEVQEDNIADALVLHTELTSTIKANGEALHKAVKEKNEGVESKEDVQKTDTTPEEEITEEKTEVENDETNGGEKGTDENPTEPTIATEVAEEDNLDIPTLEENSFMLSFEETLLESIDMEVEELEKESEEIVREIVEKDEPQETTEKETPKIINPTDLTVDEIDEKDISEESPAEKIAKDTIEKKIESLDDIKEIKAEIKKTKTAQLDDPSIMSQISETQEDGTSIFIFNEAQLRAEVETLILEEKYGKAFVILETILEFYKKEDIGQQVEADLGISIETALEGEALRVENQKQTEGEATAQTI